MQIASFVRRILSSVACLPGSPPTPPPPHYLINSTMSRNALLNIKCGFDFLYNFIWKKFLILRRIQGDIIIKARGSSSCKVPLCLSDFNLIELSQYIFEKSLHIHIYWKSPPPFSGPSSSMRTGGWRGMTKLIVAFHNFANVSSKTTKGDKNLGNIFFLLTWRTNSLF